MTDACKRTYVTLCVYTEHPENRAFIDESLGLAPTRVSNKPNLNGWFFSTKDEIESVDVNIHLDALLEAIEPKRAGLLELQKRGYTIRIFCFWESMTGNGGPVLRPDVMMRLGGLNLELHFDIWLDLPENESSDQR